MKEIEVLGFQMDYSKLDLKLFKENPAIYHYGLIHVILNQAQKGYAFSKIFKANKKGTSIRYKQMCTKEVLKEFEDKIEVMVKEINEKYGLNIELENEG